MAKPQHTFSGAKYQSTVRDSAKFTTIACNSRHVVRNHGKNRPNGARMLEGVVETHLLQRECSSSS